MAKQFFVPDELFANKRKFGVKTDQWSGDGFFIDEKYQGKIGPTVADKKVRILVLLGLSILLLVLARIFYLQIIKGGEYRLVAEGNRIKTEIAISPRGIFYDRHNQPLVANEPKFSLFAQPCPLTEDEQQKEETIKQISFLTNLTSDKLEEKLKEMASACQKQKQQAGGDIFEQEILLVDDIGYQKAMFMEASPEKFIGLKWRLSAKRIYYGGEALSPILGYLGKISEEEWQKLRNNDYTFFDLIGRVGLEKEYEEVLRGQVQKNEKEVDARGQVIKTINQRPGQAGENLILSIDQDLNQKLFEVLKRQTRLIQKVKAAAVALKPATGEVLALVSLPSFDSNFFSEPQKYNNELKNILADVNQPLFNRVVSGEYPSGSTIKPLIGAAALEEKIITEWTQVLSTGGLQVEKWFFPDWQAGGHGLTNITKALAESINTFFYYLGGGWQDFKGLGLEKIVAYAKKFGLGNVLGIDLPNEAKGFLPTKEWKEMTKKEPWYIGDTYHLSIGQGDLLVTPLQLAAATAAVVNGGKLMQPFLIKEVVDVNSQKSILTKPKILNENFIDQKNLEIIKKGLRQAVTSGSARGLADLPLPVGAKTGTAQVGGGQPSHAWLTVFAPYENPEIVLVILIENGGEGSVTALPVAREVLAWWGSRNKK